VAAVRIQAEQFMISVSEERAASRAAIASETAIMNCPGDAAMSPVACLLLLRVEVGGVAQHGVGPFSSRSASDWPGWATPRRWPPPPGSRWPHRRTARRRKLLALPRSCGGGSGPDGDASCADVRGGITFGSLLSFVPGEPARRSLVPTWSPGPGPGELIGCGRHRTAAGAPPRSPARLGGQRRARQ
jgi:hypothetical protein